MALIRVMAVCSPQLEIHAACLTNLTWQQSNQVSASLAFSRRTANTIFARSNGTIIALENISDPSPQSVSPADLFFVLNRFFNDSSQVTTFDLIAWVSAYINVRLQPNTTTGASGAQLYLCSLLTAPQLWFQDNWMGGDTNVLNLFSNAPLPQLPSELYVPVSLAQQWSRILIARWTVIVYLSLTVGLYLWCIGGLSWGILGGIQGPRMSPYPLLDFAARVASGKIQKNSPAADIAGVASSLDIPERLEKTRLFLREIPGENDRFTMTMEGPGDHELSLPPAATIGFVPGIDVFAKLRRRAVYI